jgi:hypothetical protein
MSSGSDKTKKMIPTIFLKPTLAIFPRLAMISSSVTSLDAMVVVSVKRRDNWSPASLENELLCRVELIVFTVLSRS